MHRTLSSPLVKLCASLFAAVAVTAAAPEASAGCSPACRAPQICRYEAAGGHFYCADPVGRRGGALRMQSRGGRRSSTANQGAGNAPPTRDAPNGAQRTPR